MPRILVADDNSNIHRTVALALKDAGVEVVAVGNGEAAVRKIAEIKPDLVLADIFMPVRSGYEVCEFVKQDPRFAGVPVVLLIGAFDPFDEREAQRVHADAILKKPFVPPDSLLRTVADLLAQSALRASAAPASATVAQAERPSPAAPAAPREAQAPEYMDAPPEEFAPAKARLEWDSGDQPMAFGTLLETPGAEAKTEAADESVMTAQRDPHLGEPAFWVPKVQPESEAGEAESEEAQAEAGTGSSDQAQWPSRIEVEEFPALTEATSEIAQAESLIELSESAPELPELVLPASAFVETKVQTLQDAELSSFDRPPARKAEAAQQTPPAGEDTLPDLKDFAWAAPSYPAEAAPQQQPAPEPEPEPELELEIDIAPEKKAIDAATPGLATLAPFLASLTSAASARGAAEPPEEFEFDAVPELAGDFQSDSAKTGPAEPLDAPVVSQLDPAAIEAIAQRVIERMQPGLIELVTRELLRPAVEALVQRELEKK